MSKRMIATKPEPVKRTRKPKAVQPAQKTKPVRKPKLAPPIPAAAQESPAPEPVGDWWTASHLTLKMLAVTLARYGENEGRWKRRDVREDLLKARALISTCLDRGGIVSSLLNTMSSPPQTLSYD